MSILEYLSTKIINIEEVIDDDTENIPVCPICNQPIRSFPAIGKYKNVYCLIHEICMIQRS